MKYRLLTILGIALLSLCQQAQADSATSTTSPLAEYRVGMMESGQYSLDDLAKQFPEFQHKPFDQSGFNALVLPFHYSDPAGIGNANEAGAMSFVISYDLDWARTCYCNRHAYFVFHRDPTLMEELATRYDSSVIAAAISGWRATHALGGTLVKSADGYGGTLQIFDRSGSICFTKTYDSPRPFFDLLGDMDVDAMTYFGSAPSNALSKYLHQRRCSDQSLVDLGSAEFMPERS
jgi:hypothetical protein